MLAWSSADPFLKALEPVLLGHILLEANPMKLCFDVFCCQNLSPLSATVSSERRNRLLN